MRAALGVLISLLVGCGGRADARSDEPVPAAPASVTADAWVATAPASPARRVRLEPIFEPDGRLLIPRATVCIPAASGPLPVLYALDGDTFVDELALCDVVDGLVAEGAIDPWVVVSVGSTERRTEVLASRPERLAAAIVSQLEPMVAEEVALAPGREARAVVGYSYGGLAAVRFALERPDDFGRVIAMSPSLWYARRAALRDFRRSRAALPLRLYLDAGSLEGDPGEAVPYMVADLRDYASAARARGMHEGNDLRVREIPGQSHDMALAATRLPDALRFALADR